MLRVDMERVEVVTTPSRPDPELRSWSVSFETDEVPYDLVFPWWELKCQDSVWGTLWTYHAAIMAVSREAAEAVIRESVRGHLEEFRMLFAHEMPCDWVPFDGAFPKEDWMSWE